MKALLERFVRLQHPDEQIGTLKYEITPESVEIIYWFRPIQQPVNLNVLDISNNKIIGVVSNDWKEKSCHIKKNTFLNWCVDTFGANIAIDAFQNWK